MIRIGRDLLINPAFVSSVEWSRPVYASGPTFLVITMSNGTVHRIEHKEFHTPNGIDTNKLEAEIVAKVSRA